MSKINPDMFVKIKGKWCWRSDDTNFNDFKVFTRETGLLDLVKPHLKGKKVAVQAGGNCGMQVVKFADYFDYVYTFEPDPINFHCLVNNLPYDNVIKMQCCLGDEHKLVSLKDDNLGIGGFYVNENFGNIPTLRIDDLNLDACNFLQLDVEGYTLQALKGGINTINKFKPVLSVEYCWIERFGTSQQELSAYLTSLGYVFKGMYTTDAIFVYESLSFKI
jgi:FkbM family methyltransferase